MFGLDYCQNLSFRSIRTMWGGLSRSLACSTSTSVTSWWRILRRSSETCLSRFSRSLKIHTPTLPCTSSYSELSEISYLTSILWLLYNNTSVSYYQSVILMTIFWIDFKFQVCHWVRLSWWRIEARKPTLRPRRPPSWVKTLSIPLDYTHYGI